MINVIIIRGSCKIISRNLIKVVCFYLQGSGLDSRLNELRKYEESLNYLSIQQQFLAATNLTFCSYFLCVCFHDSQLCNAQRFCFIFWFLNLLFLNNSQVVEFFSVCVSGNELIELVCISITMFINKDRISIYQLRSA